MQDILDDIDDVTFVQLTAHDVVRHRLVGQIVAAYEEHDSRLERQAERRAERGKTS